MRIVFTSNYRDPSNNYTAACAVKLICRMYGARVLIYTVIYSWYMYFLLNNLNVYNPELCIMSTKDVVARINNYLLRLSFP